MIYFLPIMSQAAERIESVKAGFAGAITAAFVSATMTSLIASMQAAEHSSGFDAGFAGAFNAIFPISIAGFSGFLFAVTYRYIVRGDRNSHLGSGAVMAFALVRGLAQIQATLTTQPYWLSSLQVLENFLIFSAVALLLNYLVQQGLLKPFDHF